MAIDVAWMQNTEYDAGEDRVLTAVIGGEPGVRKPSHFKVTASGSGLGINVAPGMAIVAGSTIANQGLYAVRSTAVESLTAGAAPGGGQSRIDLVVLEVLDGQVTGAGTDPSVNQGRVRIVAGTASSNPVAPATPASSLVLATLTITSGMSTLSNSDITNMRTLGGPGPHVGDLKMWPSSLMLPAGWIPRDGRAISRTTYSELFELLGTTYGSGDGSTTFNVPDDRGRTEVGMDSIPTIVGGNGSSANRVTNAQADVLGGTMGAETHALTSAENGSHTHAIDHNHAAFTSGLQNANHTHAGNTGIETAKHVHLVTDFVGPHPPSTLYLCTAGTPGAALTHPVTIFTGYATGTDVQSHAHNFTTGIQQQSHAHQIDVPNFEGVSGSSGTGTPHNNMQPSRFYIPLIKY